MYTDLMLRFPDEAAADALLYTGEGEDKRPLFQNIDVIGVITEDEVPLDGWHVNVRLVDGAEDGAALEPFRVYPANPVRVWA